MEKSLFNAVEALNKAQKLVPTERRFTFEAEEISIRWFYHAARTAANLYESCLLRDKIQEYIKQDASLQVTIQQDYDRWVQILMDERQNAVEALPLMERDMRLDFYFGHNGAGESPHGQGVEMIKKKIELTTSELTEYLPSLKLRYR